MGVVAAAGGGAISSDLAMLLAGRDTRWWKGHLLKLNLILVSLHLFSPANKQVLVLITSATNGYDGSMMNGALAF